MARQRLRSLSVVVVVAFMLVLLAACGDDDVAEPRSSAGAVPTATELPGHFDAETDPTPVESDDAPEPENPAPELAAINEWYNSDPLTLAELRGYPVLLVFWATY